MNSSIAERLEAAGQQHLVQFIDELNEAERRQLEEQISQIDLALIQSLGQQAEDRGQWADMARRCSPPSAVRLQDQPPRFSQAAAPARGEEALRAGQVAAILVAGGQGTRLGFDHPKGMFPIGPVSDHTIFQILIERIRATSQRYGAAIPLFLMTSPATHHETIEFLNEHDRFGLPADDLFVFCQGTMPAVSEADGKLLLASKSSLALAPDGHGGMLAALARSGALDSAAERGIEHFSYGQIDNPLVQLCEPTLVGYHLLAESELTSQVVEKTEPLEKVGNVVMVDGKMRIIEYSDLPEDVANWRNEDGSLTVWAGSIAVHVFALSFLQRMQSNPNALPFHLASKKVPFVDEAGVLQSPDQPNAIKFERFIFDLLPWAENAIVVEGDKSKVFAPLKNASGAATDTPEFVKNAMVQVHSEWLRSAGVQVREGVPVEISPLWALDADQVKQRVTEPQTIEQPTYFG